eukprot:scaffold19515_cov114-Isochrysis_galbana.AAC.6
MPQCPDNNGCSCSLPEAFSNQPQAAQLHRGQRIQLTAVPQCHFQVGCAARPNKSESAHARVEEHREQFVRRCQWRRGRRGGALPPL